MKKNIRIFCFLLFTQLFISNIKAQVWQDSVAVVISPGTENKKTIGDVKLAIIAMSDVHYIGYCSNHNVYLMYVNKSTYNSNNAFYATLKTSTPISTLLLKEGSINDIFGFCSFSNSSEADLIKTQTGH